VLAFACQVRPGLGQQPSAYCLQFLLYFQTSRIILKTMKYINDNTLVGIAKTRAGHIPFRAKLWFNSIFYVVEQKVVSSGEFAAKVRSLKIPPAFQTMDAMTGAVSPAVISWIEKKWRSMSREGTLVHPLFKRMKDRKDVRRLTSRGIPVGCIDWKITYSPDIMPVMILNGGGIKVLPNTGYCEKEDTLPLSKDPIGDAVRAVELQVGFRKLCRDVTDKFPSIHLGGHLWCLASRDVLGRQAHVHHQFMVKVMDADSCVFAEIIVPGTRSKGDRAWIVEHWTKNVPDYKAVSLKSALEHIAVTRLKEQDVRREFR
jgi:hypothetical protein